MIAAALRTPLGLISAIAAGADPVGFFRNRAGRADPFRLIFPGLGEVTFFGTRQAAHDILTAPSAACRAPTPNPIEPIVGQNSLILISGDHHRRERGLLMPAFHGERVKGYADVIASATAEELGSYRPGQPLAVNELAVAITLHAAVRVVFSVADVDRRRVYTRAIKSLMAANTAPLMLLPALRKDLGGHGPWARLIRLRDDLDQLLSDDMADRQCQGLQEHDMLDLLLSATDENGQRHSEVELRDQLRTLLAAGHETTATSLTWALYHVYRDESVRRRVEAELADCPSPRAMTALPYLEAVVKETLRMHPPVPIVLRRLTASLTIEGVSYPPGNVVGIALYALHFNTDIWRDPDRFDPDRFLDTRTSPFDYAPFGGGHRRCIGAAFATSELAVAIGTIMRTLELRMPPDEMARREPRSSARGIAIAPRREITLEVVERR